MKKLLLTLALLLSASARAQVAPFDGVRLVPRSSAPTNLAGGVGAAFGLVPDGALPPRGPGAGTVGTTRQVIGAATVDAAGRIAALSAINNMVNVYSFGAKCDGVTDDYAAIQTAVDSCRDAK